MVSAKLLSASALFSLALAAGNNAAASSSAASSGADSLTLLSSVVQKGSEVDGQESEGTEAGQTASQTSDNNFINFCEGQTLTNGLQILTGSCNGIVMGKLPAKTQMITTIILNPKNGQTIESGTTFNITLQTNNLQAGDFTNADATYYAAPQDLSSSGIVIGHTHVTVQNLGNSLNPSQPPDPTQFAFFKGINDPGNGAGLLSAEVTGGLPPGNYRVCTLTAAANHQPVIMPVAQRGSQDDCTKFTVNGNNNTINAAANNGAKGSAAAALAASAVQLGPGAVTGSAGSNTAAVTSASTATESANAKGNGGAKAAGGSKGKGSGTTTAAASQDTATASDTTAASESTTASKSNAGSKGGASAKGGASSGAKAATQGGTGAKGSAAGKGGEKRDCNTPQRLARLNRRHFVS